LSRIRKPSPAVLVAVVALVAALGGVAIANPLASDGKVRFCYRQASLDDPGSGSSAVYVVNAGHPCDGDYPDSLVMNQTGPRGLPGPLGPLGPRGPQGLPGVKPLPGRLTAQSLGDLKQVDKKNDKTDDKLKEAERRLQELMRRKGEVDPDRLAREQQRLLQMLLQVQQQVQAINDVNQSVIRKLAG
jgi:hypothetical protein